jgi:hypothetical protein
MYRLMSKILASGDYSVKLDYWIGRQDRAGEAPGSGRGGAQPGQVNQSIKDIRAGVYQMVGGGITLATQTGPTTTAVAAPRQPISVVRGRSNRPSATEIGRKIAVRPPASDRDRSEIAVRPLQKPIRDASSHNSLTKTRANGDVVIYYPPSNVFAVRLPSGAPKTMFRPDPAAHGYPTNLDYFNAQ